MIHINQCLAGIRHVALDMDGTIYRGGTLFQATGPFLSKLKQMSIGYTFLTNNSSRSREGYLAHLRQLGVEATPDQIDTSVHATLKQLHQHRPRLKRLFVLGTTSLRHELRVAGFVLTADSPADEPEAVVVYTDIVMAQHAGVLGVLVLTGETTPAAAAESAPPPDLIVADLDELGRCFETARRRSGPTHAQPEPPARFLSHQVAMTASPETMHHET